MNSKSPWSSHTMCWLLVVALACVLFRGLQDRQALRRAAATRSTMEEAQVALATDVALIVGMLRYLSLDQEVTLEGVDLSGGSWVLDLARLDRPLAIVAVNPTCPACREELPEVQLALEAARCSGGVVIGIGVGAREAVDAFVQEQKLTFPVIVDASGTAWDVLPLEISPMTVLLHGDGTLDAVFTGRMETTERETLRQWLGATCDHGGRL